jgi:CxxC motif-containing protein (DUF1111 family)
MPRVLSTLAILPLTALACGGGSSEPELGHWLYDPQEALSGGNTTLFDTGIRAFAQPAQGLMPEHDEAFFIGNALFNRGWIIAPASVSEMDGLGPLYNSTNCSACHLRDGRGRPPETPDELFSSMLIRISIPGEGSHGQPLPEPSYGGQIQPRAIPGVVPEGREKVSYDEITGRYADGELFSLRRPRYTIEMPGYGALHPEVLMSARVGPHLVGLGLLEAVSEDTMLSLADPEDRNLDGISGRPNVVWDVLNERTALGRFGWKANQPSLFQQTAGAFNGDIGITSSLFPVEECTSAQTACLAAPRGEAGDSSPQLRDLNLEYVVAYVSTLAVPARRNVQDPTVTRGKRLFDDLLCARCHTPRMKTGIHPKLPELSNQTIRPFTDLLLHDMGPDLADGRPDFKALGTEWRTPPLWGLGLVPTVNRHRYLLHDGRARGFAEAILWHGGEAATSREEFKQLSKADRDALIAFLDSF